MNPKAVLLPPGQSVSVHDVPSQHSRLALDASTMLSPHFSFECRHSGGGGLGESGGGLGAAGGGSGRGGAGGGRGAGGGDGEGGGGKGKGGGAGGNGGGNGWP